MRFVFYLNHISDANSADPRSANRPLWQVSWMTDPPPISAVTPRSTDTPVTRHAPHVTLMNTSPQHSVLSSANCKLKTLPSRKCHALTTSRCLVFRLVSSLKLFPKDFIFLLRKRVCKPDAWRHHRYHCHVRRSKLCDLLITAEVPLHFDKRWYPPQWAPGTRHRTSPGQTCFNHFS